jgi:hypothetical protein
LENIFLELTGRQIREKSPENGKLNIHNHL